MLARSPLEKLKRSKRVRAPRREPSILFIDDGRGFRAAVLFVKTVNELNAHEHWRKRQRRAKEHREQGKRAAGKLGARLPCRVTLTRIAPSSGLDPHDGYPASLKHVVDGIADAIGVPDKDPRVEWVYAPQKRGDYAVEIQIEKR